MELVKLFGAVVKPAIWVYQQIVEQPQLELSFGAETATDGASVAIADGGSCSGGLMFTVRSLANHPVELTSVRIAYKEPLQLSDPKRPAPDEHDSFFAAQFFNDKDFPFALGWEGSVTVEKTLLQGFGAKVTFPDPNFVGEVLIQIISHVKQKSRLGFLSKGRDRVTTWKYRVRLTTGAGTSLLCPGGSTLTSPMRFFDKFESLKIGIVTKEGSVYLRGYDVDGRPSVTQIELTRDSDTGVSASRE